MTTMVLTLILTAIIFLIPTNWFFQLTDQHAYLTGLRVDYLIPKLYLIDLLAFSGFFYGIILWLKNIKFNFKLIPQIIRKNWILLGIILMFTAGQIISALPLLAGLWTLRILIYGGFSWILLKNLNILRKNKKIIFWALSLTIIFQGLIGIRQFTGQSSVGGYWFFGETNLNYFANISKVVLNGQEKITAYGTTAHPNILGGFMAIFLALCWRLFWSKRWKMGKVGSLLTKLIFGLAFLLGPTALILTFSISGWLTFLTAGLVINRPNLLISKIYKKAAILILILSIPGFWLYTDYASGALEQANLSISRRIMLVDSALKMWLRNLISGVGLGQFTLNLENFSDNKEVVRFLQPVHQTLLLWLTETGLVGLALVIRFRKPLAFSAAVTLPSLIWDHYWLSQPNALLIFMILPVMYAMIVSHKNINFKT